MLVRLNPEKFNFLKYFFVQFNLAFVALRNRQMPMIRGKMIGGSGAVNTGLVSRGNRLDYDNWANNYGARGWSYPEVLPYFLMSENNTDPAVVAANPRFHSTSGPVQISTLPNPDPIFLRMRDAANRLGWPITDYSNLEEQYGTSILQGFQSPNNWTRQSTGAAYIEVNIGRPNLHVLINSHVTRIIFNNQNGMPTATGVEFVRGNRTYTVGASREVIISAGPVDAPQLLMLSGVGPRQHLAQFNIPLIADLPVGSQLYEHVMASFDFVVNNSSDIGWSGQYFDYDVQNLHDFLNHQTGPLTRLQVTETYFGTGINGDRNWPDGMMYLIINQG